MAVLRNISSPDGEKSATASSRFSITDSKSVGAPGEMVAAAPRVIADNCALTASNELPRSRNSCSGRSSRTSSSPRPRRVRPLWITWMGRSIHCASSIDTSVAISSAASTVPPAARSAPRSCSIGPAFTSGRRSSCSGSGLPSSSGGKLATTVPSEFTIAA
jgi:hypothetical protein